MLLNNVDFISSDSNLANGCTHFAPPKETNRWTGGKLTHNIIKKGTHNLLTPPRLCLQTAEKE